MEKSEGGFLKLTEADLEAAKSPKGGWTAKTLAAWGVPWPAPHGWKKALLKGEPIPVAANGKAKKPEAKADDQDVDHKALLHQVVMAVINAGHGHLLNELPEVAAYYNCRIPTVEEVIGGRPEMAIITGGITFDDRVYGFTCARQIRASA
jgi:hypothetical protein